MGTNSMYEQSPRITVTELLSGNVRLASPPELFLNINHVLDDPKKTTLDACRLIENDPGLSARLLKIVNSPYYGFPTKIASINQAIRIVGIRELKDLVLATLVVDKFSSLPNGLMTMSQFWMLSVRCALIARYLSIRHPNTKQLQPIFICGLLHEIGRLIVYHRLPELARAALLRARAEGIPEHTAQRKILELDHYEVGAELARAWRLPEAIVITIQKHDYPDAAGAYREETRLVWLASQLSAVDDRDALNELFPADAAIWHQLGIKQSVMEEVRAETETAFMDIFKLIYPSQA